MWVCLFNCWFKLIATIATKIIIRTSYYWPCGQRGLTWDLFVIEKLNNSIFGHFHQHNSSWYSYIWLCILWIYYITYPSPNFYSIFSKLLLTIGHGWLSASHKFVNVISYPHPWLSFISNQNTLGYVVVLPLASSYMKTVVLQVGIVAWVTNPWHLKYVGCCDLSMPLIVAKDTCSPFY